VLLSPQAAAEKAARKSSANYDDFFPPARAARTSGLVTDIGGLKRSRLSTISRTWEFAASHSPRLGIQQQVFQAKVDAGRLRPEPLDVRRARAYGPERSAVRLHRKRRESTQVATTFPKFELSPIVDVDQTEELAQAGKSPSAFCFREQGGPAISSVTSRGSRKKRRARQGT